VSRPPGAPSGGAPPQRATLPDGSPVELVPLAREIARRHRLEFPDEAERYGNRGLEWCVYDNQWLLSWAIMAASGWGDFHAQLVWLAGILESRGYPVIRLARDLELAADVATAVTAEPDPLRGILLAGAEAIRARQPASS
jgi:hypothetical protein